jgi:predicted ATP-dependent endonuclease of OLD family
MNLKTVFVRFYKSFNFDYLKKYHAKAERKPWELLDGMWYPHIRIPIDPKVTTIVGANESGKSHLLTAIEKGISGKKIKREDFCRYSQFFTVERGKLKLPEFGFEWTNLSDQDRQNVLAACEITHPTSFDSFLMFRTNENALTIYLPKDNEYSQHNPAEKAVSDFQKYLPHVFTMDADIALPDSVSIRHLATDSHNIDEDRIESLGRYKRVRILENIFSLSPHFKNSQAVTTAAEQIASTMSEAFSSSQEAVVKKERERKQKELELARKLVLKVANIDPDALMDLHQALRDGKEGHANAIIKQINDQLAANLNFPHWWVQDKDFRLIVSPREYDLVFTIRDKTETEYSFSERSSGLKYFLSYYVQYRSHEPLDARPEILLMDEPDAFLSSQAQQDLLKVFQAFASPEADRRPVQVIYVTHSPFLIDKNHSERIRVLEKGVGEEGTRIVRDASKNHYEPLRSAFGAFVGETTFIGNCNLMVEGPADQILIAGAAAHLQSLKVSKLETLDLNHVTIVPAGSASHVPYLVYLARGRDVEQPAVIVLLDSDQGGNDARKKLGKGGAHGKQVLKDEFVLQIGELQDELAVPYLERLVDIEDLIPLPICVEVVKAYSKDVCGAENEIISKITEEAIRRNLINNRTVFEAIEACLKEVSNNDLHIEKVGFARITVDIITKLSKENPTDKDLLAFEQNMKALFRRLDKIRRQTERELGEKRISQRLDRAKDSFLQDHPTTARREEAHVLLEDIEAALDDSAESDSIRIAIANLRRNFSLNLDMVEPIDEYESFKEALENVKYAGRIATQVPAAYETE